MKVYMLLLMAVLAGPTALAVDLEVVQKCAQNFVSGVDVSGHQPWTEWPKLRQADHHFAYVKATEGLSVINPFLYRDFKELSTVGMYYGAYHYYVASVDPIRQAQYFLAMAGAPRANELPPMFDWETNYNTPVETVIKNAKVWLELVEKLTGRTPVIYTYPAYWKSLRNKKTEKLLEELERFPLFIADYRGGCPEIPFPWKNWLFWQRGIKLALGVNGQIDDDVFNGTLQDLENFLKVKGLQ